MADFLRRGPCCKPLRLLELFFTTFGFVVLFMTRKHPYGTSPLFSQPIIIFLFVVFGSLMVLTGADVLCQMLKDPTANLPMLLLGTVGFISCLASGILSVIVYDMCSRSDYHKLVNTAILLAGASFLASLLYLVDVLILFRFREY